MIDILVILIILVAGGGSLSYLAQQSKRNKAIVHSPTQAITSGDVWYRHALSMARLLERIKSDTMISCTFDDRTKDDVARVLHKFWEEHEINDD